MSNDTGNSEYLENDSINFLTDAFVGHVCWALFGIIGIFLNSFILIVIYRTKEMRTSGVYNMVNLAMSDLCLCLVHGTIGVRNAVYFLTATPLVETAMYCFGFSVTSQLFVAKTNNLVCLTIAIDRLAAVIFPVWFRNRGITTAVAICATPWLWGVALISASAFYRLGRMWVSACATDVVVEKWFIKSVIAAPNVATMTTTVCFYIILTCIIGFTAFKIRRNAQALIDYKNLIEFKMIRSLGIIILVYVGSTQMTTFVIQQTRVMGYNMRLIVPMMKSFWVLNSAINFIIYIATNSSFRMGFRRLVRLHPNRVHVIVTERNPPAIEDELGGLTNV